jgi:hypothetical protein
MTATASLQEELDAIVLDLDIHVGQLTKLVWRVRRIEEHLGLQEDELAEREWEEVVRTVTCRTGRPFPPTDLYRVR